MLVQILPTSGPHRFHTGQMWAGSGYPASNTACCLGIQQELMQQSFEFLSMDAEDIDVCEKWDKEMTLAKCKYLKMFYFFKVQNVICLIYLLRNKNKRFTGAGLGWIFSMFFNGGRQLPLPAVSCVFRGLEKNSLWHQSKTESHKTESYERGTEIMCRPPYSQKNEQMLSLGWYRFKMY